MNPKKSKGILIYAIVTFGIVGMIFLVMQNLAPRGPEYDYGTIMKYFDDLEVKAFDLDLNNGKLDFVIEDENGVDQEITYTVPNVSIFVNEVLGEGENNYRQKYNEANPDEPLVENLQAIQDNSFILSMIPTIILIGLMIAFFFVFMRQANGGGKVGNFGKSNAKTHLNVGKKATFADVAGADEEKEELKEIVDFLKDTKKYSEIGARVPKGVLLLGPPGTGKTLLARAVAGEAGVPFFSISGSDFVEMFVGVGASRVRDLFGEAKKSAPAIIFIDEIDAVGRHRGAGMGGGHDEREQTLNQLLVEMDGFAGNEGIIVMAATNRRDILDPALLRPGRFDRQILVSYPDVKGREEILKVHARNKPLAPDVDLNVIAKTTQYFTGADLENLLNEAALLAARANRKALTEQDLEEAVLKVLAGPEKKSAVVTEHDRKITAYHEAGHAVAAFYLETCEKVHQVTVIQRGMAAGITVTRPTDDNNHVSKRKLFERIVMTMGGRCAEALTMDDICTGASHDIEQATKTARAMVTQYGFSEKVGAVNYGGGSHEVFLGKDYGHTNNYSEEISALIDSEIREIITTAYEKCENILKENIDKLHLTAKYLIAFEKVDGDEFEKLMNGEITEADVDAKIAANMPKKKEVTEEIETEKVEEEVTETVEATTQDDVSVETEATATETAQKEDEEDTK